jgi:hypothetical protein
MYHPSFIAQPPPRVYHYPKQTSSNIGGSGGRFTVHVTLSPVLRNLFVNSARRAVGGFASTCFWFI